MAMSENQITTAWERLISAETYALYFGNLASRYSAQRQFVTFVSFFFSSGAAVTALSRLPFWVPTAFSLVVVITTAYSVAIGLESKIKSMAKLHYSWMVLAHEYTQLWERTWADDADTLLYDLMRREQDLSLLATTDAPNDSEMMLKSQLRIFQLRHLTT